MAARSKLEVLIELAGRLPWWLAVILAVASYLGLHAPAQMPPAPVSGMQDLSGAVTSSMIRSLAMFGQYLVPAVLVLGAILSGIAAYHRRRLFAQSQGRASTRDLQELSWQDFERLVGQAFRERGFNVAEAPVGPDGGIDLTLRKDGELHLVQCKRWRAQKVGVEIVRELYGVMAARGAIGGYVVTCGAFSPEAQRFAQGRNIELWDGAALKAVIRGVKNTEAPFAQTSYRANAPVAPERATPACPSCGAPMVERRARKGPNSGQAFWGCSQYPNCRGTRPMGGRQ